MGGSKSSRRDGRQSDAGAPVTVDLTLDEMKLLVSISTYYQRSMTPFRHLVRLISGPEMRRRFQFVDDESTWLKRFAQSLVEDAKAAAEGHRQVLMTPRATVALWGRLLSSLNVPRSRRRLSTSEIQRREELCAKLRDSLRHYGQKNPQALEREINTRRSREIPWIRDALAG